MKIHALLVAVGLGVAGLPAARADAIPMPVDLNEFQHLLVGEWREDNGVMPTGLGHSYTHRTIGFGNESVAMLVTGGISYSNDFHASAYSGTWTAERVDSKTIKVKMTQSAERGTEWTLVFEGDDAFTLTDAEWSYLPASRFSRIGRKIQPTR